MNKVVGLEITQSKITAVELEKQASGVLVRNIASTETPNQAVKDGVIINTDVVSQVIRKLFQAAGITTKKAVISLSGKGVIVQSITLPSMPSHELNEVVRSELERYPLLITDKFVFDYKPLSEFVEKGYNRTRVFLSGISYELLNSYFECMKKAGISIESIDVALLSLITSQYADIVKGKATASLLISDKKTQVTIVKDGKFHLFYSIDVGDSELFESTTDSNYSVNEKTLNYLLEELERIFKFYEKEFESDKVERVIVSYNDYKFSQLTERISSFFSKHISIETANPFKNIKGSSKAIQEGTEKEAVANFAVATGAALRGLDIIGHSLSLKLLQHYIPRPRELKRAYISTAISFAAIVLVAVGIYIHQNILSSSFLSQINEDKLKIASLDQRLQVLRGLAEKHKYFREVLKRQASYLKVLNRVSWSVLLSRVTNQIPDDAWLDKFKADEKQSMKLDGGTFTVEKVAGFIRQLAQDETFGDVCLDEIKQKSFTKKATGVEFKIESKLADKKENIDEVHKEE